jgi:hypothetical protein
VCFAQGNGEFLSQGRPLYNLIHGYILSVFYLLAIDDENQITFDFQFLFPHIFSHIQGKSGVARKSSRNGLFLGRDTRQNSMHYSQNQDGKELPLNVHITIASSHFGNSESSQG